MKNLGLILFFVAMFGSSAVFAGNGDGDGKESVEVKIGLNIGDQAPDLKFKTPEGKEVSLSSLRGKIVLVDFWSSWCKPCRIENPNVVKAYNKFKDASFKSAKGFEVYGFSLDKGKEAWIKAIKEDKLTWTNVSDLKSWSSEVTSTYKLKGIPYNYLLDENGIIIGKNLKGANLHAELQKLMAK